MGAVVGATEPAPHRPHARADAAGDLPHPRRRRPGRQARSCSAPPSRPAAPPASSPPRAGSPPIPTRPPRPSACGPRSGRYRPPENAASRLRSARPNRSPFPVQWKNAPAPSPASSPPSPWSAAVAGRDRGRLQRASSDDSTPRRRSSGKQPAAEAKRSRSTKAKTYAVEIGRHPDRDRPQDRGPGRRDPRAEPRSRSADPDRRADAEAAMRRGAARRRGAGAARAAGARAAASRRPRSGGREPKPARPSRIEAKAWIVLDARSGDVLASHAAQPPPADRQHDQADDRLRGDAGAAAGQDRPRRALRRRSTASRCWDCRRASGSACATSSTA